MSRTLKTAATAHKRPGRQRSAEADQAIMTAALDILVEGGYGEFTMQKVIARAGVSSATLYRRWTTADELVTAVLRSIQPEPIEIDTGSLDGDLQRFIEYLSRSLDHMEDIAVSEASGPRAPEELRKEAAAMFANPRMQMLELILQRAFDRGELETLPDTVYAWTYVVAPVHHWRYLQGKRSTTEFLEKTRAVLGAGLRALAQKV